MPKIQLQLKLPLLLHHPNSLHPLLLHPRFAVRYCIRIELFATVFAAESATSSAFSRPLLSPLLYLCGLRYVKAHARTRLYLASEVLARSIIDVTCINGDV